MIVDSARHLDALRTSSRLSESFRRLYQPAAAMIIPEKIVRALNEAGIKYLIMGTHGINGYRDQARATHDVDLLVRVRDHRKAVTLLRKLYPKLQVREFPAVTRLVDPTTEREVIDLMRPYDPLYREAFKNGVAIGDLYSIPNLEMALASKYAAMISPNRLPDKKHLDAGDFINIVRNNQDDIDLDKLRRFGELAREGGGDHIIRCVEDAIAGRTFQV
jgi:hypothetical protein